jgi:hypothetical protein
MSEELNAQRTNMQADYTQQISDLQENVTVSFDEMNSQIETNNTNLNTKIDSNNQAMNQTINNQTSTLATKIATTETNITNSMNSNDKALSDKIDALNKKVDDSFTSVSNGKTKLAAALLTKGQTVADNATFDQIYNAILNIQQNYYVQNADITAQTAAIKIRAHFHTTDGSSTVKEFSSFQEYSDYYASHQMGSSNGSSGGCYTSPVYHSHGDGCYDSHCENKCETKYVDTGYNEYHDDNHPWNVSTYEECHEECYSTLNCSRGGQIEYYSLGCGHYNGQILSIELVYANE